jgi:hypothetical protein
MTTKSDIITPKKGVDKEMTELICPKCQNEGKGQAIRIECHGDIEVKGIIRCLLCQHERPFTMTSGYIRELDTSLPGAQSDRLNQSVPADIKEDIREAERDNYAQCYKSCVTMCRRALQLGFIDKKIADKPLSKMLLDAKDANLLSSDTYSLATSIKGYGDIGTHRKDILDPMDVNMVIHATVRMLNELFPS